MSRRKRDFLVGEVVFAQVKGTPWWPARVDSVDLDKRTAMVTFYPSKQMFVPRGTGSLVMFCGLTCLLCPFPFPEPGAK